MNRKYDFIGFYKDTFIPCKFVIYFLVKNVIRSSNQSLIPIICVLLNSLLLFWLQNCQNFLEIFKDFLHNSRLKIWNYISVYLPQSLEVFVWNYWLFSVLMSNKIRTLFLGTTGGNNESIKFNLIECSTMISLRIRQ